MTAAARRLQPAAATITAALLLLAPVLPAAEVTPAGAFLQDFDTLTNALGSGYAYFDRKQTDWRAVTDHYRPLASGVHDRSEFVSLLEQVLDELYDNHTGLNTNLPSSQRLVPTGADIWAEWQDDRAIITELRRGFSAEQAGLRASMQIVKVNGVSVEAAVAARMPATLRDPAPAARNWALRAILAGTHDRQRTVTAFLPGRAPRDYALDRAGQRTVDQHAHVARVQSRWLEHGVGYISVNDLVDDGMVSQFDAALAKLRHSRALILDLRDIPGGGSTEVAEPMLGRFIRRELAYQQVAPLHEPSYLKRVAARGEWSYDAPLVVLVSHWTASMAEGMAIGLDGMRRGIVVGTRMAALNGGVFRLQLPNSGIGVNYVGERLNHVNGTAREIFTPPIWVDLSTAHSATVSDPVLQAGLDYLKTH